MQRDPQAMDPAELRCLRESLGLSIKELARVLGLDAREASPGESEPALARSVREPRALYYQTVSRWEWDIQPISRANAEALARLVDYTNLAVETLVDGHAPGEPVVTYADDDALHQGEPGLWPSLPASWHRAVAWRAAEKTGARLVYRR